MSIFGMSSNQRRFYRVHCLLNHISKDPEVVPGFHKGLSRGLVHVHDGDVYQLVVVAIRLPQGVLNCISVVGTTRLVKGITKGLLAQPSKIAMHSEFCL